MIFEAQGNALIARRGGETLRIESWGKDSLRVRSYLYDTNSESDFALTEKPEETDCRICISQREDQGAADGPGYAAPFAEIENGRIRATVNFAGVISFYRDGNLILREYFRSYGGTIARTSRCLKIVNREWKGNTGGSEYRLTVRFDPNENE